MGPLNRPLRRELEKLFSNPRCLLRPNWPTFLAEIYISSAVKVRSKVSSHEMNPNFWFRQEGERFESQQVGGGGEVARLQNCIQHFCPLFPPNGPPLVILDHWRFSLFEWITRVVAGKNAKMWRPQRTVPHCGRDGGRPLQTIIWSPPVQETS